MVFERILFFFKMKLSTVTLFTIFLLIFTVTLVAPQDDDDSSNSSPSGIYNILTIN